MFGRTRATVLLLLACQFASGCCCYRPFFCCGNRFFAPCGEPCSSCYQPNGAVQSYPAMPMGYMKSPSMPNGTPVPSNAAPGTIPSFPASAAGTFTSMPVR